MSLAEVRGHKQSAFTRLRSTLSRHIALNDIPNVKLYIDKLKVAFAMYEAAHEDLLNSIKDDLFAYDEQGECFVQTEELYVKSLKSASVCIDAESTSTTSAISQLMNMPRVEIKSFDGSAASYLTFMAVFDEIVGNVNITDQAKLTRLLQYTTGDARNAIDCCALIGGVHGYVEARRILKERFGDSYIISTALINKLKQNTDVRTPSALRTLADELNSAKIVLKSLKMYSELDNQHHIKEIGSRLSSHLWDSWRDRVFSIKRKHARYATFDEFVDYVSEKADEANDPVYGLTRNANPQGRNHTPVAPKNTTSLNSVTSGDVQNKSCVICDDQHPVFLCKDFKSMSIPDRKDAVNKFKLCVNCLKSGHTVTECYRPSFCRHPNCSSKHNILLHENVVVGNTIDDTVCNDVCMPIVPAVISNTEVYCLLDTGSTSTFISNRLASKLNLDVTVSHLIIKTLNNSISKDANTVNFTIASADHEFTVDMKNVHVVESIPTKKYAIDVNRYPHLREIDPISSFNHEVDLLIGQDYACCFVPLDVLKGQQDEPYAVKTPLGYVIHGANSDNQCYNSTVSHSISTLMTACCTGKLSDECDMKMPHGNTPDKRHGPEPMVDMSTLVDKYSIMLPHIPTNSDPSEDKHASLEYSLNVDPHIQRAVYNLSYTHVDNVQHFIDSNDDVARVTHASDEHVNRNNQIQMSRFTAADIFLCSNVILIYIFILYMLRNYTDQIVSTSDCQGLGVAWDTHNDYFYLHLCIADVLVISTRRFSSIICYSIASCMFRLLIRNSRDTIFKDLNCTDDLNHVHVGS